MNENELEELIVELTQFVRTRFWGKHRAVVEEVDGNLARIRVKAPRVYGDDLSPWALPALPFAGKNHGLVLLPEKGDGVWIEFEAGDPSKPIWTGFWFGKEEMPNSIKPDCRSWITPTGHEILMDDGQDTIQIKHSNGSEIRLTSQEITMKIGRASIVLSALGVNINQGALEVKV